MLSLLIRSCPFQYFVKQEDGPIPSFAIWDSSLANHFVNCSCLDPQQLGEFLYIKKLWTSLVYALSILRPVLSGGFHNVAIGNRNRGVNQTADAYRDGVTNLQNMATSQSISSRQQYETDMKVAIDQQAQSQIAGVDAGAGQAIGGYQQGAAQARGGLDQNYRLELGANREIYGSQVNAAGQVRSAGLEAAKLRQAAAVIAQVGREISRELDRACVFDSESIEEVAVRYISDV